MQLRCGKRSIDFSYGTVQIKSSDKSSKFSKNEKAAKSDKLKSGKAYNPSHSK